MEVIFFICFLYFMKRLCRERRVKNVPSSENNHYVKFYRGSANAWDLLLHSQNGPDNDTLYFVYDSDTNKNEGKLYLGDRLISAVGNSSGVINLDDLGDISINNVSLADQQLLVYNDIDQEWQNVSISELKDTLITEIGDFIGATPSLPGLSGLVPAPAAGDHNSFLTGNSSWTKIDSDVFTILPNKGLSLSGFAQASTGTIPVKSDNGIVWSNAPSGMLDTRIIITLEELQELIENEDPSVNEHNIYMIDNGEGSYDEYRVINGQLIKINNSLPIDLNKYVTKIEFESRVGNLESILNDTIDESTSRLVPGLVTKVEVLEIAKAKIGDLNSLVFSNENNTTLVEEINSINERLMWKELTNE